MKKNDIILIIAVLVVGIIGFISTRGTEKLEDVNYPLELVGESGLHQLSYSDYIEKVDAGEAFIVIIERTGCGYCEQYMPIVAEVASERKLPLFYIDTSTLTDNEMNLLSTNNNYLKKNNWGTPTTLFMLGSRVLDSIPGYVEKATLESFLDGRAIFGEINE